MQSPVLRADGDFLGVVIPAGKHQISIKFEPESLWFGGLISAFGLGLMVVTLLLPAAILRPETSNFAPQPDKDSHVTILA